MLSNLKINDDVSNKSLNDLITVYETNFFKKIDVNLQNNILLITIDENPIISNIKIKGIKANRIKEAINNTLSLREKSSFNEIILKKEKEKILELLKQQGYLETKINIFKEIIDNNKINLIFDIDLGKKAKIKKITFVGDKIFKDQKLKE